ncbi:MAG: YggT family protein [Nitrospinota bacterium]|nr:YggT family protein [Nitrospinota bacterium]
MIVGYVLWIYVLILVARVIISWVDADPYNPFVQFLFRATEPILAPIRYRIPDLGGFDLSPIVVYLIILFLQEFLVKSLYQLATIFR